MATTWCHEKSAPGPSGLGAFLRTLTSMDEVPADVLAWAEELAGRLAREDGITELGAWGVPTFAIDVSRESTRKLVEYWVHGAGAGKIRWGTDGSMKRCIRHLRKYVARSPGGLCAEYHRLATGQWPTEGGEAGVPS